MIDEEQLLVDQAQAAIAAQNAQTNSLNAQTVGQALMTEQVDKGLAEEQLDLSEELEQIEHLLAGHSLRTDVNGVAYWDTQVNEAQAFLNEEGVKEIMQVIRFYLSKRKLLANYSTDEVLWKMEDFAIRLADLIFMKYREMGLNTEDKKKKYEELVYCVVDSVHDIYSRAINGKERDSIRKHWNIQENMGGPNMDGVKKAGMANWFRR